jgi:hypothetical protein
MDLVTQWIWIIVVVGVVVLLVHPKSQASNVIGSLSNEATANIKALQGGG